MLKRKLQKSKGGQYFLSIPNQLVKAFGWDKGDTIVVSVGEKQSMIIRKK